MRTLCIAATLAALAPMTRGQEPELGPRSFFPPDYTGETYVDLEALRDTDLWDGLQRQMVVRMALAEFRRSYGFALDDVRQLRTALLMAQDSPGAEWVTHSVTSMVGA